MRLGSVLFCLCAATTLGLQAQEGKAHFGLTLGLASLGGDLGDFAKNDQAFTLGARVEFPLNGGHVLTPRLDWGQIPGKTESWYGPSGDGYSLTTDFKHVDLGLDYQYYPSGRPQGFNLLVGLSSQRWTIEAEGTETYNVWNGYQWVQQTFASSHSESRSDLTPVIGLGWTWNRRTALVLRHSDADVDGFKAQLTTLEFKVTF